MTMQLVLASKSPRRQELLRAIGIKEFIIHPARLAETVEPHWSPEETVCRLAQAKAEEVAAAYPSDHLVLAADTLVFLDGRRLGKPRTEEEAEEMLQMLSGRSHTVFTGVALLRENAACVEAEETAVCFRDLTEAEIRAYVASGEPMDKAGAYGIQGPGAVFVEGIRGDFYNVMGLPLCRLGRMLGKMGITTIG